MKVPLEGLLLAPDAASLYPATMSDPKSILTKIETAEVITSEIKAELIKKKLNNQTLGDLKKTLVSWELIFSPADLIIQQKPTKEMVPIPSTGNKVEVNRLRNGL